MARLEDLPDEVFVYGIFPYLSWQELCRTFIGLTARFNAMLRSTSHLKFTVTKDTEKAPVLLFFAPCIRTIEVWLGQFDVRPFLALRSLTLKYPSLQQRNSIRPTNFPFLERLNLAYPLEDVELLHVIFSSAFPSLKKCRFDRTLVDPTWSGSSTLRSLAISVNRAQDAIVVLRACPNLRWLHIIIYEAPEDDIIAPHQPSLDTNLLSLRHLFIRSRFQRLAAIINYMPDLQSLTYEDTASYHNLPNQNFSFAILANLLLVLPLRHLHFSIVLLHSDHPTSLSRLHRLFRYVERGGSYVVIVKSSIDQAAN